MTPRRQQISALESPLERQYTDMLVTDVRDAVWALGNHLLDKGIIPNDQQALIIHIALEDFKKIVMGWAK